MMIMAYLKKTAILYHLLCFSIVRCQMFVKMKSKGVDSLQSVESRGLLQCATVCVEAGSCRVFEYNPSSCTPGKQMKSSKKTTATQTYAWFMQDPSSKPVSIAGCDQRPKEPTPNVAPCSRLAQRCVQRGELKELRSVLKDDKTIAHCKKDGRTLLLDAASYHHDTNMFDFLLKEGSDICTKSDRTGSTVLHEATGSVDITRRILDTQMINIEEKDKNGLSALMDAVLVDQMQVVRLLYDHGADLRTVDAEGRNVLHNAGQQNQRETVRELLKMNISGILDGKDMKGNTPVVYAAQRCYKAIVKMFQESGCDMTVKVGSKSIKEHVKKCRKL